MSQTKSKPDTVDFAEEPDIVAQRKDLLRRLQAEIKESAGAHQFFLQKVFELVDGTDLTRPQRSISVLIAEVQKALKRFSKELGDSKKPIEIPNIIREALEFSEARADTILQRMTDAGWGSGSTQAPPEVQLFLYCRRT